MERLAKPVMALFMVISLFNFVGILAFDAIHPAKRGFIAVIVMFIGVYFAHSLDREYRLACDWSYIMEWWDSVRFNVFVVACAAATLFIMWYGATTRLM